MSRQRAAELLARLQVVAPRRRQAILETLGALDPRLRTTFELLLDNDPTGSLPELAGVPEGPPGLDLLSSLDAMPATLGDVVGSVELVDVLGAGGMGTVFRGEDAKLERTVAVKTLRADRSADVSRRARFKREARILSQLDHPGICKVYDLVERPEADYLILEFVEGETLGQHLSGSVSPARRLELARAIAEALAAAHAKGVVHRDLKPDNVMVRVDGSVKILDFGIARIADAADPASFPTPPTDHAEAIHLTQIGSLIGTLAYMSPEQARGEEVTTASDVYSLGLIFQELLGGAPAHPTLPFDELLERARRGDSAPVTEMRADLAALIAAMKAHEPALRPTTREVVARLRWCAGRRQRAFRNVALVTGIVVALLAVTQYVVGMNRERAMAQRARALAESAQRRAEVARDTLLGIFRLADPESIGGGDLTVRELLRSAVEQLNARPLGRAEDTALLLGTLGEVYSSLGLYNDSLPLLEAARDAARNEADAHPVLLADIAPSLAQVYAHLSRFDEAERTFRQAIALLESHEPLDVARLALLWAGLGEVQGSVNEMAAADSSFERALELSRLARDLPPLKLAELEHHYANHLFQSRRFEAAVSLYEAALAIRRAELPIGHPRINALLNNIGVSYFNLKDYPRASEWLQRAVEADERALGPDHPDLGYSLSNLADAELALGRLDRSDEIFSRSLRLREAALGPDHLRVSYSLIGLARVREAQGRLEEAERLYQRTAEIRRKLLPENHPDLIEATDALRAIHQKRESTAARP